MGWSEEMADVVNECLTEFPGQILSPVGIVGTIPQTFAVCFDYRGAQAGLDSEDAGVYGTGRLAFTMRRANFQSSGLALDSLFARATDPALAFVVDDIDDNEARPFVRIMASEKR